MTLMVRDELDLVAAMIEHHIAQGIDLIIATDNGSVDGTREVLADYAALGLVELHDDPRHEKQQAPVVTAMARRAFTEHDAAWVINADADEFWFAAGGGTVAEALRRVPAAVQSFDVPVKNLFGRPLEAGSAVRSHVWRDERDEESLNVVGLHAHPTQDCVHRGSATVEVVQGNHATDLPLTEVDAVPAEARLEVLHLPFRTWERYRNRVETTARAYAVSGRTPSPRHHGIRDARWLEHGELRPVFAARHPRIDGDECATPGFVHDGRLRDELLRLVDDGARLPERLAESLAPPVPLADETALRERYAIVGPWMVGGAEWRARFEYRDSEFWQVLQRCEHAEAQLAEATARADAAEHTVERLRGYLARITRNLVLRLPIRVLVPEYGWPERRRNIRRRLDALRSRLGRQ